MTIIGITGSIGAGKTTTAKILERLGAFVIDVDKIAKEIMIPGSDELDKIINYFGKDIISVDNSVNYQKLAEIVFSDKEKLDKLNSIIHPKVISLVREKIEELRNSACDYVVIDAALLFETELKDFTDINVTVTAEKELRINRIEKDQKMNSDDIEKRSAFQLSDEEKINLADYLIENNGTLKDLEKATEDFWYNVILKRVQDT
ncbi:MAG: dephospho-CoA kinase [Actinobacteria bacterium]|nr:dephospho-CoA kinase [Actinomycetota bacterium]